MKIIIQSCLDSALMGIDQLAGCLQMVCSEIDGSHWYLCRPGDVLYRPTWSRQICVTVYAALSL